MNAKIILSLVAIALISGGLYFFFFQRSKNESFQLKLLKESNMKITSSAFENNGLVPKKYTCDGENINPPLEISDVPENAQSLVLIIDDPDAPMGTWTHWTVWSIDPKTTEITENNVPAGAVEGVTDFGRPGYGGPCPPSGTHRYFFKIYALDTRLNLTSGDDKRKLENAIQGHILTQAEIVGLYGR